MSGLLPKIEPNLLPSGYTWEMWRDVLRCRTTVLAVKSGYKSIRADPGFSIVSDIWRQFNADERQHECFSDMEDW